MKSALLPLVVMSAAAPSGAQIASKSSETSLRYEVPATVSPQAKVALEQVYAFLKQMAQAPQTPPVSPEDWSRRNAMANAVIGPRVEANIKGLDVKVREDVINGVPVLRVTPPNYVPRKRALIYAHGGGYVLFTARTSLTVPALVAVATGDEVISVDYTVAPTGNWRSATDQVVAVYKGVTESRQPQQIGLLGDSAGGGLVAGSVLKMRDQQLPLPGALYLLSPWADITDTGDTYQTLALADPSLDTQSLKWGADAYAPSADQRNPYVSPVYGDYSKAFPPTLIQGGTREIFISNFVRQYQAIRNGGHEAVLDLYEGMPHVFQALIPSSPETAVSIKRAASFFDLHLGKG
jgi:acetyl esterase/lipase